MLKVAFFTEAGSHRGYGHFIRSYTIYEEFKNDNSKFFLDSDLDFSHTHKDIIYFKWDTLEVREFYDIILIDSYEANLEIYSMLQKQTKLILYIDDYKRLQYPPGIIINFAPNAKKLFYPNNEINYHYMLGTKYIPIRKEFKTLQVKKKEQLFLMLGGMDTTNITLQIMQHLQDIPIQKVVVHNKYSIAKELKKFQNTMVLYKPDDITLIKSMKESSIAITTASMSAYELAYAKTPSILISTAKNQDLYSMLEHKIAYYGIKLHDNWLDELKNAFIKRREETLFSKTIIDGCGAQNIYHHTMELL